MAFLGPDVFRDSNPARCTRCNNRGNVGDWLRIAFLREQVAGLGHDMEWLHTQFPDQVAAELGTTSEVTGRTPSMVAGSIRRALSKLRTKLATESHLRAALSDSMHELRQRADHAATLAHYGGLSSLSADEILVAIRRLLQPNTASTLTGEDRMGQLLRAALKAAEVAGG